MKRECNLPNVLVVASSSVSEWAENADGFEEYRAEAETNLRGMIEALVLRCLARCHKCRARG